MRRLLSWASLAVGIMSAAASAQVVLTGDLPGCTGGGPTVLSYSGVDVVIGAAGVRLNCNTIIVVTGGDISVQGPVVGRKSHSDPRPDGQDGYSSFSLTLQTKCGPRRLTDVTPDGPAVPPDPIMMPPDGPTTDAGDGTDQAAGTDDDAGPSLIPSVTPIAQLAPSYCGDIKISAVVDLSGEYGTDGRQADSAGTGFAGGNGGAGGSFTAISVGHITQGSVVSTSGGNGGSGGAGGPATGCDAAGQGNGGWGAAGGPAGSVSLTNDAAARKDSTISFGGYYDVYNGVLRNGIVAVGGSSGNGGPATQGGQHGCGATAGAGGSAANGAAGGKVNIVGKHVVASTDIYNTAAVATNGGNGGNAGPGASAGSILCNLLFTDLADFCPPPINGGPAGDAGAGGAGGPIYVAGTNAANASVNPISIEGVYSMVAGGGQGGSGASGGNGGVFVDYITPDCSATLCCGSGGFSTAGDSGGAGGSITIKSPLFLYSASLSTRGGNGGFGTYGSSGGCGPCDGEQGGAGGAGGAGGGVNFSGNQAAPFNTAAFVDRFGGCGGGGGNGAPGGEGGVGGAHGTKGAIFNGAVPPVAVTEPDPPCSGSRGPDGLRGDCTP